MISSYNVQKNHLTVLVLIKVTVGNNHKSNIINTNTHHHNVIIVPAVLNNIAVMTTRSVIKLTHNDHTGNSSGVDIKVELKITIVFAQISLRNIR